MAADPAHEPADFAPSFSPNVEFEWEASTNDLSLLTSEINTIQHELQHRSKLEKRLRHLQNEKRVQIARHIEALKKELVELEHAKIAEEGATAPSSDASSFNPLAPAVPAEVPADTLGTGGERSEMHADVPEVWNTENSAEEAEDFSLVPKDAIVEASGAAMEVPMDIPERSPVERAQTIDELIAAVDAEAAIPTGFSISNTMGARTLGKAGWKWTLKEIWADRMNMDMLPDDYGFKSKLRELKSFSENTEDGAGAKKAEEPKPEAAVPWNNPKETLTAPAVVAITEAAPAPGPDSVPPAPPQTEAEKTRAALFEKLNKVRELKHMAPVASAGEEAPAPPPIVAAAAAAQQNNATEQAAAPFASDVSATALTKAEQAPLTEVAPISARNPDAALSSATVEHVPDTTFVKEPPGREESTMKALLTGDYRFLRAQVSGLTPSEKKQLMEQMKAHQITDERFEELLSHVVSPQNIINEQLAGALARAAYASEAKSALKSLEVFIKADPALAEAAFDQSGSLGGAFFMMLLDKLPTPVSFERFIRGLEETTKEALIQPSLDNPDGARKKREALALLVKSRDSFTRLEELLYGERYAYWKEFKRIERLALAENSMPEIPSPKLGSAYTGDYFAGASTMQKTPAATSSVR